MAKGTKRKSNYPLAIIVFEIRVLKIMKKRYIFPKLHDFPPFFINTCPNISGTSLARSLIIVLFGSLCHILQIKIEIK